MRAKTKGIIALTIGGIFGLVLTIAMTAIMSTMGEYFYIGLIAGLVWIPLCAIGGFGYAFGWHLGKRWLAKIAGVAVGTSILFILFSRDRRTSFILTFMFLPLVFSFTVGMCYLPGIVIGIKAIRAESRLSQEV
jgi:uncharacterized membrane protein